MDINVVPSESWTVVSGWISCLQCCASRSCNDRFLPFCVSDRNLWVLLCHPSTSWTCDVIHPALMVRPWPVQWELLLIGDFLAQLTYVFQVLENNGCSSTSLRTDTLFEVDLENMVWWCDAGVTRALARVTKIESPKPFQYKPYLYTQHFTRHNIPHWTQRGLFGVFLQKFDIVGAVFGLKFWAGG